MGIGWGVVFESGIGDKFDGVGEDFDFGAGVAVFVASVDTAGNFDDIILDEEGLIGFEDGGENDDFGFACFGL